MSKPSSNFAGNVFKLATGSVIAQGLGVLVAPIVTRLFAPEAFGVSALFASITGLITAVACLRYELSIMLPKTDDEAANLLGVSLFFVLIITGISALIIFFATDLIVKLFNSSELKKYLWLVPLTVFVSGMFLALNYWNSRTKRFGRLSIARVMSSVVAQTTKLGAGFAGFVSGGVLIGASILGQIVSTFILASQIWRDDRHLFKRSISWKKMIAGLKRHKKFPIYSTWSSIMNTASQQLPVMILAFYFSPKVVGFYALGRAVLGMPMNLLGRAVAQVFFQRASEAYNQTGSLSEVTEGVFRRLVSLSIFPILLLTFTGKDLFIVFFGPHWAEAGVYVQILALSLFFVFISSPISTLFSILEKQHLSLFLNLFRIILRTISLIVGGLMGNARIGLALFAATGIVASAWLCFWLLSSAGTPLPRVLYQLRKYAIYCFPIMGAILLAKWALALSSFVTVIIALAMGLIYYIIIFKQDPVLRQPVQIVLQRVGLCK